MGSTAGAIMNFVPGGGKTKTLPHWIVISVDTNTVKLFASDRKGLLGPLLAELQAGTFRASLLRNIGEVDLNIYPKSGSSISLKGKWGPFHRQQMAVARGVVAMTYPEQSIR